MIHIGRAVEDMPKEIIGQLMEGGVIFVPVGTKSQKKGGNLKMKGKLDSVQRGPFGKNQTRLLK